MVFTSLGVVCGVGVVGAVWRFRRRVVLGCSGVGVGCWCCSIVGLGSVGRRVFGRVLGVGVGGFWWVWALGRSFIFLPPFWRGVSGRP